MDSKPSTPDQPNAEPASAEPSLITPTPEVITPSTGAQPAVPVVTQSSLPELPAVPATPVMGGMNMPPTPMAPVPAGAGFGSKGGKKKKLIMIGAPILGVLLIAGFVFGYYLPNRPQAVWKTGLDRSGKALDTLIQKATEKKTLESAKKSNITLDVKANYGKSSYNGTFNSKFDTTKSDSALAVTLKQDGQPDKTINGKILSEIPSGAQFPNIYFQVSGLKSLGLDEFLPSVLSYDGKWISVDESYFKSLGVSDQELKDAQNSQLTSDDIATTVRSLASVAVQYGLTSKPDKAIFDQKSYVGKEKVDGISAFHYTVGLNKGHLKDFCKAIIEAGVETPAYKKFNKDGTNDQKGSAIKDCQEGIDQDKDIDTQTFDLWVDAKYKLIHKVRLTDKDNTKNYVDVGQSYKGGDEITMFANYHYDNEEKGDITSSITANLKTLKTSGKVNVKGGANDEAYTVDVTLTAEPYSGDIKVTAPDGAIPIRQLIEQLGFGDYTSDFASSSSATSGSLSSRAQDVERDTDIKALHGQIEAFYAAEGYYPSRAHINDASWRAKNMKGLDQEALKDPAGTGSTLAAAPAKNSYSYAVTGTTGKSCEAAETSCAKYVLTAYHADGTTFTKENLN